MTLDRIIVKEIEHPKYMSWDVVEKWADIPVYSENDPLNPEWKATPCFPIDLSSNGYGIVYIKNESDARSNPTKTIKDRMAWELTTLFRDYARGLYLKRKEGILNGNLGRLVVPRFSVVTAGNVGKSIAKMYERFGLPPVKMLVDSSISKERLDLLKELHADVYVANLNDRELSTDDIKELTNNKNGIDITSVRVFEPNAIFYDWHVHEVFNEHPNQVYIPYGSGRLFENYLTWQERTVRNNVMNRTDPRLRTSAGKVADIDILGAEPESIDSVADKLVKYSNPFAIFSKNDIAALNTLSFSGNETGTYKISEDRIIEAYEILRKYCDTEPSAAAGLALYLKRFDESRIHPRDKILIVNTGKGI